IAADEYYDELDANYFGNDVSLYWTTYGIIYRTTILALRDSVGNEIWKYDPSPCIDDNWFSPLIMMPGGTTAFAFTGKVTDDSSEPVILDLASGKFSRVKSLSVNSGSDYFTVSRDGKTLIYVTSQSGGVIKGDPNIAIGKTVFSRWPFDGPSYAVSMWR